MPSGTREARRESDGIQQVGLVVGGGRLLSLRERRKGDMGRAGGAPYGKAWISLGWFVVWSLLTGVCMLELLSW